jgi:two-component system nitrate/nitrite response regulator NarL
MPVRVLIVDDHVLFAEAIQLALHGEGVERVDLVSDAGSAIDTMRDGGRRADVVLMDLGLPGESGIEIGGRIAKEWPETKVLALTAFSDPRMLRDAMQAGFSGYLTKDTQVSRLVNAMRTAMDGEVVIPHKLAAGVAAPNGSNGAAGSADDHAALLMLQLTDRECEVLQLLAEGAASETIAHTMSISRNTVRTHVQSILAKLGVHSRLEAAAFAVRHGIVSTRRRGNAPSP